MRRTGLILVCSIVLLATVTGTSHAWTRPPEKGSGVNALDRRLLAARATGVSTSRGPAAPVIDNFEIVGHTDLGASDTNGDVWVHGDFAYVGTWADPCNGLGVKIVDVTNPTYPVMIGRVGGRKFTSAEDVVVRSVSTSFFSGDLLAVGLQRCGGGPAIDQKKFGPQFWDVTDPYNPEKLSFLGVATGGGGVHELDLFQRGESVYALLATPGSEFFDLVSGGDFRIVDVTDPRNPVQVGEWGAHAYGFAPGPFYGLGSLGAMFDHSARASADGTKAYVSYWDLGVLTLDITDVTNPTLLSRTEYAPDADGEAHSVSEYQGTTTHFLLQNDEDFDPRSPAHIVYGDPPTTGIANESPFAMPLWEMPGSSLTADVVRAKRQGCEDKDYPGTTAGRIVVVRTLFPFFDEDGGIDPLCTQKKQQKAAAAAGAAAAVHDFISEATSPQWFPPLAAVDIPVLFTDHATAAGMRAAGVATLEALEPSWGFLRVFDAATGEQVAKFDGLPGVHELPPPEGFWSIHNNEVLGNRSYASWYTNGIVALDLSPLNGATPSDPVMVGQFVPEGAPSHSDFVPGNIPIVWGVAIRASDGLIFASDMNGGLWIVRPTGPAAP